MDDPEFTATHLEELRAVGRGDRMGPLTKAKRSTPVSTDLAILGLVRWDAGRTPGHERHGGSLQVRREGVWLTPAGRLVLALAQSLDGTAPPQNTDELNTPKPRRQ